MEMHNPPHPGGILKDAIESLGLSVTEAARQIGVSRVALSRVINEQAAISVNITACDGDTGGGYAQQAVRA